MLVSAGGFIQIDAPLFYGTASLHRQWGHPDSIPHNCLAIPVVPTCRAALKSFSQPVNEYRAVPVSSGSRACFALRRLSSEMVTANFSRWMVGLLFNTLSISISCCVTSMLKLPMSGVVLWISSSVVGGSPNSNKRDSLAAM